MRALISNLFFFCSLTLSPVFASSATDWGGFEKIAESKLIEHRTVGASIALIEDRKLKKIYYLGHESQLSAEQVSPRSLFQVASISKSVTAWVAMTLVRDGLISLDEPINPYLTRWQLPPSSFGSNSTTLRQLLSHTAGLSSSAYQGVIDSEPLPSLEGSLRGAQDKVNEVKFILPVGEQFSYSGGGYSVIQLLIEELTDQTFADYARTKVLVPLGMNDSSFAPSEFLNKRLITPHGFARDRIQQRRFRAQAAANLHTTAADLSKFVIANLSLNKVHSAATIQQMHSAVISSNYGDMGLGFFIDSTGIDSTGDLIGHSGSNFGWKADMRFSSNTGDGIVLMTNSESGDGFNRDMRCYWAERINNLALIQSCGNASEKRADTAFKIKLLSVALSLAVILLAISIAMKVVAKSIRFSFPKTRLRWCLFFLLIALIVAISLVLFTPLGVWLFTGGLISPFQTIGYAPAAARFAVILFILLLTLLSLRCFMVKQTD